MRTTCKLIGIVALSLPACGGGGGIDDTGEDPGPDAGAPTADTGGGAAICSAEYPVEGMKVVFHDAGGLPLGVAETNAAGLATFAGCVDGGMVTLVRPSSEVDATRRFFTVQGVNVGDLVRFNDGTEASPYAVTPMSLTIQNNLDEVTQNATGYVGTLGVDCMQTQPLLGASGGTIQANSLTGCLGDDPTTIVALSIARDANSQPVGFARSSTTDLVSPSIAAGGQWVAYAGPTQVQLVNIPAEATSGFRTVIPKIDGVDFGVTYGAAPLADGPLALHYWPTSIIDEHRIAVSYSFSDETSTGALMRTATPPASLDMDEMLLERPRTILTTAADPTRPVITWQDGDDRADFTRAELGFTDGNGPAVWVLVAPGNPHTLQVPVLDAAHANLGPSAGSLAAVHQFLLVDRETTYATHLTEGVMAQSDDETYKLLGVREVAGTTLRYAGYVE